MRVTVRKFEDELRGTGEVTQSFEAGKSDIVDNVCAAVKSANEKIGTYGGFMVDVDGKRFFIGKNHATETGTCALKEYVETYLKIYEKI